METNTSSSTKPSLTFNHLLSNSNEKNYLLWINKSAAIIGHDLDIFIIGKNFVPA
ncbi:uncharacterized protein G2W53_011660 [Senna tora]|uniref:Uncharacterized protein n=1 Tax=Senna tora TaxID=362788 RepID=A0A835CB02_9FABA|nr:uncharacterized protein G2W53_011660 [Senna tora]